MKEFEFNFAEGLRTGLRKREDNPVNSQSLTECHNLKPAERGLVPFEPLTNPISGLTIDWPLPQLFIGSRVRLLALRNALYSLDSDWVTSLELDITIGAGELSYLVDDEGNRIVDEDGNFIVTHGTEGSPIGFDFADFGEFILMTNGRAMMKRTLDEAGVGVYSEFTSEDAIPGMTTLCAFKGQIVGGNIITNWHNCGANSVVWSDIGSASFIPDRKNEAGYRPMPWEGSVLRVRRLGETVMVYGSNGMTALIPVSSPAPTFGMKELPGIGVASREAVGGDEHQHVFVDAKNWLWRIKSDLAPELLGYQEYMSQMTASDIVVSYDPGEKEFYISDGVYGFLLNDYGLCQIHQLPTSVFTVNGSPYGVFDDSADEEARVTTDVIDHGLRALKTVSTLELGTYSPQVVYSALDWRSGISDPFTRSDWIQANEVGVTTNMVTANEFRICFKTAAYANVSLDYIKSRVKLADKRAIRGAYSAA